MGVELSSVFLVSHFIYFLFDGFVLFYFIWMGGVNGSHHAHASGSLGLYLFIHSFNLFEANLSYNIACNDSREMPLFKFQTSTLLRVSSPTSRYKSQC